MRWEEADVTPLYSLQLSLEETRDVELRAGLAETLSGFARHGREDPSNGTPKFDFAHAAGHLKRLEAERDRLAEAAFNQRLKDDEMRLNELLGEG